MSAISGSAQRQMPFEGIITYIVKTEAKDKDNPYNKYYAQRYGDTLTVYYHKNGSERRVFNNTGPLGYDYIIYNKINNEQYNKHSGIDSIFYYNTTDTTSRVDTLIASDTMTIMGKNCQSIYFVSTSINSGESSRRTFYYSGEEFCPPRTYIQRKRGHMDKLYGVSQSKFLGWELDLKYIWARFEAISIERQNLDPNLFIAPNGIDKIRL